VAKAEDQRQDDGEESGHEAPEDPKMVNCWSTSMPADAVTAQPIANVPLR